MTALLAERTGLTIAGTPVEDHTSTLGLWVKREDRSCPGGPHFSKVRGVVHHVAGRPEGELIGVLDTSHSQGGWAVAAACARLGRGCVVYFPVRKGERGAPLRPQQVAAQRLGATLVALQAGRSAILHHRARVDLSGRGPMTYMMPNALKLPETVDETAAELARTPGTSRFREVLVSASSGTIAAGVLRGLHRVGWFREPGRRLLVHLGYSRSLSAVREYLEEASGTSSWPVEFVDEGYNYADAARPGVQPGFPCNEYYDLKALRWWYRERRPAGAPTLFWNIG